MSQTREKILVPWWSAPVLLFVFAFITRFLLIGKGLYHPDAILFLSSAQELASSGQLHAYLTGYNLPVILGALFLRVGSLFGADAAQSLNMLSVVCGAAAIPIFYILCLRLFDRVTALASSFVLLSLPHLFVLSTFANSQIVTLPFLLLGLCMLVGDGEKESSFWILAAIFLGLAGASRPQDIVFMAPGICFLFWWGGTLREKKFQRFFIFWSIVVLTVIAVPLPFLFYDGTVPDLARFRSLFIAYVGNAPNTFGTMFPMLRFSVKVYHREFQYVLIFILLGTVFLLRQKKGALVFLTLWFLGTFIGYTMTFHKIMPTSRYLLLSFLPGVICAGYGVRTLYSRFSEARIWRMGGLFLISFVLFISLILMQFEIIPILSFRHVVAAGEDFGRWVGRLTPVNAVVLADDERDFISKYGPRRIESPRANEYHSVIKRYLQEGTPVYLIYSFEARPIIRRYEAEGYQLVPVGRAPFEYWVSTTSLTIFNGTLYRAENIPIKEK